jgi:acetyl-CoA carboxylase biotin carboxyl carrier protein
MLKVQEIREIIKLVDQSSITEFVYEQEGSKIKLKKIANEPIASVYQTAPLAVQEASIVSAPQAKESKQVEQPIQQPAESTEKASEKSENLHKIISPMVGTFYLSPAPDQPAYVASGSKVSKDSIVCIVEAMKLFNEIEAEVNGEIVEVLAKDGQLVEYGQTLFLVKPE